MEGFPCIYSYLQAGKFLKHTAMALPRATGRLVMMAEFAEAWVDDMDGPPTILKGKNLEWLHSSRSHLLLSFSLPRTFNVLSTILRCDVFGWNFENAM